jgi:hypothetical protein
VVVDAKPDLSLPLHANRPEQLRVGHIDRYDQFRVKFRLFFGREPLRVEERVPFGKTIRTSNPHLFAKRAQPQGQPAAQRIPVRLLVAEDQDAFRPPEQGGGIVHRGLLTLRHPHPPPVSNLPASG